LLYSFHICLIVPRISTLVIFGRILDGETFVGADYIINVGILGTTLLTMAMFEYTIFEAKGVPMGDKGKRDKGKREEQKKGKQTLKEKRKQKKKK